FFFSMFMPLLISTLFPYTTLFRSINFLTYFYIQRKMLTQLGNIGIILFKHCRNIPNYYFIKVAKLACVNLKGEIKYEIYRYCPEDRKSTRLNSSHVSISYAVFCLK